MMFIEKLFSSLLLISLINLISASKHNCDHLSPYAWKKLPLSVDLAKLDLFPERENLFSPNGFKDRIFNFTCKQNVTFQLPNLILKNENITYYLPDFMSARAFSHNLNFNRPAIDRINEPDEESYKKNMMNSLRVDSLNEEEKSILQSFGYNTSEVDNLFTGAFKLSLKYMQIRKERLANARIPIDSRINITAYYIELNETKMALTNAFQNEIQNLPTNYENSNGAYGALINTFGTHYFQYFVVGGLAKTSFKVLIESPDQSEKLSEDEFKNDRPFEFDLSGLKFDVDENFGTNVKYFLSDGRIHKRTINFYGGLMESNNPSLSKWMPSALLDPWIIGGGLAPLSRLIKDNQKKRNFLREMMAYLDKAEVLNLRETYYQLEPYNKKEKWFEKHKKAIDNINEKKFINHTELISLSNQFNEDINVDINKRQIYGNPIPLWTSTLDDMNKQTSIKITNSSNVHFISFYLLILLLVLNITRFKLH